ncbi:Fungal specific transcription factor domain-containing protein [Cladophialophora immunda]|nr:Fungal specific transcription factor domain-containing protein [Cladophialophora immunda]
MVGGSLDEDGNREGFFGNSSAGNFIQHVKKMVQQRSGGFVVPSRNHGRAKTLPSWHHFPIQQDSLDYILPPRRKAEALISLYWRHIYILYPYLDKGQIQDEYERLWQLGSSIPDERSFLCLLNAIFAISSQIDQSIPIQDRQQSANAFYSRSRDLLDIVDIGSVRSVQSFLLLGQYFQSTSESHPCWIFTGLAIRTAQSLGLHLAETSERAIDIRTRELLRKVWHGCVLMDRVVSMQYGRPCMIGAKAALKVPLPLPVDEEHLGVGRPRGRQTFVVEFYVLSLKLYEILHDVIYSYNFEDVRTYCTTERDKSCIYPDRGQHSTFEVEIDRRLSRWKASIPDHLLAGSKDKRGITAPEAVIYRQAVVLQQRHLHVRLMLFRPALSNFITSEFDNTNKPDLLDTLLSRKIYLQCAIICVKVAFESIDTLYEARSGHVDEVDGC